MTVAIAAALSTHIVTVSDARLSYGEFIPAADEATMKNRRIAGKWGMMFAGEDATAFMPVANETTRVLRKQANPNGNQAYEARDFAEPIVVDTVKAAYEAEFHERFYREHLSRLGFADVSDFRQHGYDQLGKDLYHQYAMKLAQFDIGLELIVYGFDERGRRSIFEVANPGKVKSHELLGYAAIGSGSLMAMAALNRRPIGPSLSDAVYRLLDAKFSSETARDVGRKTYVIVLNSAGKFGIMRQAEVQQIREIWENDAKRPHPQAAIELIENSKSVKDTKEDAE